MVQTNNLLKRSLFCAALASAANAQSLFTPVDFKSTLDLYYYFRNSDAIAAITADGIDIEGSFSTTADLCAALDGAQIVYSSDDGEDVLLTSDCYSVYHLVDTASQEITWSSCQEFSFYPTYCPSGASSGSISITESSTATADETESTTAALETTSDGETLYLTTVTSTVNNIETIYTTYCPLSQIIADQATQSAVDGTTNINALPAETADAAASVVTSVFVSTKDDKVATFTSLIPIVPESTAGALTTSNGRVYATNTDYYSSQAEPTGQILTTITKTEGGIVTTYTTFCPLSDVSTEAAASASTSGNAVPAESTAVSTTEGAIETGSTTASGNAASAESTALVSTEGAVESGSTTVAAVEGSAAEESTASGVSIAEQSSTTSATGASASVITYEGGAGRMFNSVSAISIIAVAFGFFF